MKSIEEENTEKVILDSGLIYRNPVPHIFSRQAYFPWVVYMDNDEMLSSFVIGEAFEAMNLDTYLSWSKNRGKTWSKPIPLLPSTIKDQCSNCARITFLGNGQLVALAVRSHRELYPEEGLANPDTLGFVPTDLLLTRSEDYGKTWSEPQIISPPLTGPSFEACSPIVPLKDGRWLWPTSTWRGWDGYCPNGMKMIAFLSHDQGETWPEYLDIMDGTVDQTIYWEGKVIELNNGPLLSVAWAYDEKHGKDKPNHYAISRNDGKNWTNPVSTNLHGQTMAMAELPDGRLIVVYRRMDKPGLWCNISFLESNKWINEEEFCLWGGEVTRTIGKSGNMVHDFNDLKFGAPCITILPKNSVYISFWCYEKLISNIRGIIIDL